MNGEFERRPTEEILIRMSDEEQQLRDRLTELHQQLPTVQAGTNDETITLTDESLQENPDPKAEEQRAKVVNEIWETQRRELPKLYANTEFTSDYLAKHHLQETNLSCSLATTLNTLEALDVRGGTTESDIARAIGERGADARIDLWKSLNYLKHRGLEASELWNVQQVIDTLMDGGVVMLTLPGSYYGIEHEVLVSGLRINKGNIQFTVNDPLEPKLMNFTLDQMLQLVNPLYSHMVQAIKKTDETVIPIDVSDDEEDGNTIIFA